MLAVDEADLRLFPPLRAAWARRGQQAHVPLTGRNAKRVVFGALNLRTGRRHLLARLHGRREDFGAFLRALRGAYGRRRLALLLDENSCHVALRSLETARRLKVRLLWLPTHSPHLNPMDHL